jgi:hypothetical protein
MKAVASIVAVITAIVIVGCASNQHENNGSDNDRAQSFIDQGLYNEAITTLSNRVTQYPEDSRARVLLASALAAKHGLILDRFVDFARVLFTLKDQLNPPDSKAGNLGFPQQLSWQIDIMMKALHALPAVSDQEMLNDLVQAVSVLQGVPLSPGAHIYRALLQLVIFKYDLENSFRMKTTPSCEVTTAGLLHWFQAVTDSLTSIIDDIELGIKDPGQKANLAHTRDQIHDVYAAMAQGLTEDGARPKLVKMPKILKRIYPTCG